MTVLELGVVDAATPATDGLLRVGRNPFNYPDPVEENPASDQTFVYLTSTGPTDADFWETRSLTMFDFSDVVAPYTVQSVKASVNTVVRHMTPVATFEAFGYPGPETAYPFDLDQINGAGSWGDLGGNANVITPVLDLDAWIAELEALPGAVTSPTTNTVSFNVADRPVYEWTFVDTSWADGAAGGAAGLVWALRASLPATQDPTFPDAGIDPSQNVTLTNVILVVETGGRVIDLAASGTIGFGGTAAIETPGRGPAFHRARERRDISG